MEIGKCGYILGTQQFSRLPRIQAVIKGVMNWKQREGDSGMYRFVTEADS